MSFPQLVQQNVNEMGKLIRSAVSICQGVATSSRLQSTAVSQLINVFRYFHSLELTSGQYKWKRPLEWEPSRLILNNLGIIIGGL
jgi:hypothetical protein